MNRDKPLAVVVCSKVEKTATYEYVAETGSRAVNLVTGKTI